MNYPPTANQPVEPEEKNETPGFVSPEQQTLRSKAEELASVEKTELPEFDFSELESQARTSLDELGFSPLPASESLPTRRRRQRPPLVSRVSEEDVPDRLESMAHRAMPTFDFFVFALITGALMGIGYLLDAPAILLLAVVAAPFPGPWLGVSFSTSTGEARLLGQTLGGFLTAILVVFLTGLLAGLASRIFMPIILNQAFLHARLWWPDLLLLGIGTISLAILFIQRDEKPILPGLILSYELLLPISAAGFGLGNGTTGLWPQALAVFLVHSAISIVLGLLIFYYMGFRPLEPSGYAWGAGVILISLLIVAGFTGMGAIDNFSLSGGATAQVAPTATASPLGLVPISVSTSTPTPRPTATVTLQPSLPTPAPATLTAVPTNVYGRIQSRPDGDGATIRNTPGGSAITTILNGYVVEILPDVPVIIDNNVWIHVKVNTTARVIEGWVLQSLVVTPTPVP